MTLYQRIYASKGPKEAKKAWIIAGVRMANNGFHGVILGMLAKVATKGMFDGITDAASMDSEMGLPVLLATVLPVGLMGLMLSSYSAILSTADSCLMAARKHRN
jgi:SSS family solute:Na+ symporter